MTNEVTSLPLEVDNLDNIPESFRGHYVESDGKFIVSSGPSASAQAEAKYQKDLQAFRERNINLTKEKEAMEQKIAAFNQLNMSPNEIKELKMQMSEFTAREALEKNKLEEFVNKKTKTLEEQHALDRADWEKRNKALESDASKYRSLYQTGQLRSMVMEKANASFPVKGTATEDLLSRAQSVWSMDENNNLVAKDPDGTPALGKNSEPITMDEWLEGMATTHAPHLFETGSAAGAQQPNAISSGVKTNGQRKWIDGHDPIAMGLNAEAIAKGEMDVRY